MQGSDVRYLEADTEFARYALADSRERAQLLKEWVQPDLLIVDDLFLARRITNEAAEVLQAIIHQRYKLRRAIVVTSNRVVQDWGKYLVDVTMASTILDRLMHHCVMLEFEGKSDRLKEAAARLVIQADASQSERAAWGNLGWPSGGPHGARHEFQTTRVCTNLSDKQT